MIKIQQNLRDSTPVKLNVWRSPSYIVLSPSQFQFDQMDLNGDGVLQKAEVDGILTHVPHEECLYGFMISSDVDKNHVLSIDEWIQAFKYVGEYKRVFLSSLDNEGR